MTFIVEKNYFADQISVLKNSISHANWEFYKYFYLNLI